MNRNNKIWLLAIITILAIAPALATRPICNDNTGSIWTTTSACDSPQDENHYVPGETVYIHGSNFCDVEHAWDITGQPGGSSGDPSITVANGTNTPVNGAFCFPAYVVQNDDWGEYKATYNSKQDNYRVNQSIPEFGVIAAIGVLIAGIGIVLYKRNN